MGHPTLVEQTSRRTRCRYVVATLLSLALLLASGCSTPIPKSQTAQTTVTPTAAAATDPAARPSEAPATTATGDATPTACTSPTPILSGDEVHGVATDASVYGLLFLTHSLPIRNGEELKIVWRMTGNGDLSVTSTSPSSRPGVLTFGPESHSGSNYTRPGDEWGTGFKFDEAGCWHIHLQRTIGAGDVWIDIAPSAP